MVEGPQEEIELNIVGVKVPAVDHFLGKEARAYYKDVFGN